MRTDVAVVGAGPAGCAAAITLARAGRRVTVFDKATFPRDKCCGDGLTVGALRHLDRLGLDPSDVPSWRPVTDVRLRSPRGRLVPFPLPAGPGLFAVVARRRELDAALVGLARRAGVEIREGRSLVSAHQTPDAVVLGIADAGGQPEAVTASWVIGADGMWSPLRRSLGLSTPGNRGEWHAFRQYVRDVSPEAASRIWISFEPDLLPGYLWSFPVGDGDANVGFGIVRGGRTTPHDMAARWPDLLGRPHIRSFLGPLARPEGSHRSWPIPTRIDDVVLTDGRVLFVGDAAAAADPMTGEGIGQALATGCWAAEALLGPGRARPQDVVVDYEAAVRRHLVDDHRLASRLGAVLGSGPGATAAIAVGGLSPWTRRQFARWLFEDYPRALVLTPQRWRRRVLAGAGAYR